MVWNPEAKTLVSGSFDTTVRFWQLPDASPPGRVSRRTGGTMQ
jgi:hypothetical protein